MAVPLWATLTQRGSHRRAAPGVEAAEPTFIDLAEVIEPS
jgi:hypothetical protein